jgi:hypothetical protein
MYTDLIGKVALLRRNFLTAASDTELGRAAEQEKILPLEIKEQ